MYDEWPATGHWPLGTGRDMSGVSFSSKTKWRKESKHKNVNGKMIKKQVTQLKMVETRGREGMPFSQGGKRGTMQNYAPKEIKIIK